MWKQSSSFWESVSLRANVIGALAGVIAATTALFALSILPAVAGIIAAISAFISWYASRTAAGIVQMESDKRIAAAEQRAVAADEKAEQERLERLRIEAELAPRSLSCPEELIEKLEPFAGTSVIVRGIFEGGPDVVPLTNQVVSVLKAAKWEVTIVNWVASGQHVEGVIVAHAEGSDDRIIGAAKLLIEAFESDGIAASHMQSVDDTPNRIRIVIGSKP
jgi:hypothetical protein